jgi:PAS domain S-box-containing protein
MNKNNIEISLKKICSLTDSEASYIFASKPRTFPIIAIHGSLDKDDSNLLLLNKLIVKDQTKTELKKAKPFVNLIKENKFHALHHINFYDINKTCYTLVLLSEKTSIDYKSELVKINKLLKAISVEIVKPLSPTPKVDMQTTQQSSIEQTYKETLSSIQSVLYSTNIKGGEFNFISEAVRNMFGYSPEEIYQSKFHLLRSICSEDFVRFKEFINMLKNGEASVIEYRMKDRFGKEHWVRHCGMPILKNNVPVRIVGEIHDITDEKIIQIKLERSEEKFRVLVDTADDLIFMLDSFGYFSIVNKNGANALGYSPEEMFGKHFLEFVSQEEGSKIASAFSHILNSSDVTTFEVLFLDRYENEIIFEINAKPMIVDGQVSGMLGIGRNISRRKQDEQKIKDLNSKLIEANRIISIERERARHKITVLEELNKLKSEFISNVSHELRTPLASIVGFAETILSDNDLPDETVREFIGIILTEGQRLAKLINDLLDFSKLNSGEDELQKSVNNVADILDAVVKTFQNAIEDKNIVVSKEYPQAVLLINVDKERIIKVFANLLSNAVKFTGNGGRINLILQDYGKEIEFAISDTGVGIPEKELPNLFQKFSKVTRPGQPIGGTGFGLVAVKQIVDLHKGFIKVKSEANKGTTFIIRLPK